MYLFSLEKDTLMHEQSNGRHDDRESTPVGTLPARSVHKQERSVSDGLIVSPAPRIEKAFPATMEKQIALRRTRVNRILMRKRRYQRLALSQNGVQRLMLAFVVICLVLFALLSSSAGAAFAYYQAQLPLLSGVASHSLFQTTHIYDRNGHLLYQLYDQREGRGRRTYVNYSDLSI